MEIRQVYLCEDEIEGIFTAVYDAWTEAESGVQVEIRTRMPEDAELFCEYHEVVSDEKKYRIVCNTIKRRLGEKVFREIGYASAAACEEKGTAIYRTLAEGLRRGKADPYIMQNLRNPAVRTVAKLYQKVWYEYHHMLGFLRFEEMEGGRLAAFIHPENDILLFLAMHFANRFPNENWMILDTGRKTAVLHVKGKGIQMRKGVTPKKEQKENRIQGEYEELWKAFCKRISIPERKNGKLQQQFVPLKFRDCMTEFKE